MTCPTCGDARDRILDSRYRPGWTAVRRRRLCMACGQRWTTYERHADGDGVALRRLLVQAIAIARRVRR